MTDQPTAGAPWDPPTSSPPSGPAAREGAPPRRRATVAAIAVAGLGLGGLLVAGRMASADDPSVETGADTTTPEASDDTTSNESTGDDTSGNEVPALDELIEGFPVFGDLGFGPVGECLADQLGIDITSEGGLPDLDQLTQLTPDELSAAWDACRSMLPDDVEKTLDDVTECVSDSVEDGDLPAGPLGPLGQHGDGGVTVMTPDELSVLEFGEGDGSVTITKSGDDYTIESSGDVSEVDLGSLEEVIADVQDSLAECDISLPFDLDGHDGAADDGGSADSGD
jgi:hypothetical protein